MNKLDLDSSIILIGPKGIGKSLIAEPLKNQMKMQYVLSTDFLRSIFIMFINGNLKDFESFKRQITKIAQETRINKAYPNQEELKVEQLESIEKYFKSLRFGISLLDFNSRAEEYYNTARNLNKIIQYQNAISKDAYNFLMQYYITKLANIALNSPKLKGPIVVDAGADFAIKYNLSVFDIIKIRQLLLLSEKDMKSMLTYHDEFIKKFKHKVCLLPGVDYQESSNPKVHDYQNEDFLKHIDDYVNCSNIIVNVNGMFYDNTHSVFKVNQHFRVYEERIKDALKNKSEIANICETISTMLAEQKQFGN